MTKKERATRRLRELIPTAMSRRVAGRVRPLFRGERFIVGRPFTPINIDDVDDLEQFMMERFSTEEWSPWRKR